MPEGANPPQKILVVVLDNLGDAVMATAILRPLLSVYPHAQVGFWVKQYAEGIFEDQTMIERVHAADPPWDTAPGRPKGDWEKFRTVMKEIQEVQYDAALILNSEWRRAAAVWWLGIPRRIGIQRRKSGIFLTQSVPRPPFDLPPVEAHLSLVENLTGRKFQPDEAIPRIEATDRQKEWADGFLGSLKWKDFSVAVVHPFSGDSEKNWPLDRWFELIRLMNREQPNLRFVLVCTPKERPLLDQELKATPRSMCQVLAQTYFELKGILSRCDMFIGGDSGPGHVAAALGKPVLSLFGPTDPARYAPRGRNAGQVIQKTPLSKLSVDDVKTTLIQFLKNNPREEKTVG